MEERMKIPHPYLSGNFAPIKRTRPLTRCTHVGHIPEELAGGQYVRNGGNPVISGDVSRDAHWFDGDGMLTGVLFRQGKNGAGDLEPEFVNRYALTDVFLNAKNNCNLKRPLLPSIATLISASLRTVIAAVARTLILVFLSRLPGSRRAVKRISVANTGVIYHDGRALATCESGPPMRFQLPTLETIGWYNGRRAENERGSDDKAGFGGYGPMAFMREWTTGHPHVDPVTGELMLIHVVLTKPFVYYSIVPRASTADPCLNMPIPGLRSPKMMHDFGVSSLHSVIMDLPLSLDPMNSVRGKTVISYNPAERSRFGIFPRYQPEKIRWFETNPCVIFHTANCWHTTSTTPEAETCVHLLACRLTSASVVYSAGALRPPTPKTIPSEYVEEEQCRLYYYDFPLAKESLDVVPTIRNQWALSAIPFEFPALSPSYAMRAARYVYGCSTGVSSYSGTPGKAVKMDYVAKIDAATLIKRGNAQSPQQIKGCVDTRGIDEVLKSTNADDPVKLFRMPEGWFAQEPTFVPRRGAETEDDGWLLTYVFDESQLNDKGECDEDAVSELWIINARNMRDVITRVRLPQRVPYGLHGAWFPKGDIASQRPFDAVRQEMSTELRMSPLSVVRDTIERWIG
ncbi:retinal pigment epithelial membrane protein [Hypoxylon sp. NC1633]|nr:retinal pigment epithelial membrane protein [Hypoxylon sp. NC1633]